jgi:hypothetical protein
MIVMKKSIVHGSLLLAALAGSAAASVAGEAAGKTSELARAAAAMKPGQWREFKVKGMSRKFQHMNKATGKQMRNSSFTWSNELCWDSGTRSLYYLNNGHGQPKQFFRYCEATNTWIHLDLIAKPKPFTGHTYNHHTITDDGVYYYHHVARACGNPKFNRLFRYDIKSKKWTSEQAPKGYNVKHGSIVSFFKPLNSLVEFATGTLRRYDIKTKKWSRIPAKIKRGDVKKPTGVGGMEYVGTVSEVHKKFVFGGGKFKYGSRMRSKALYVMDAEKKVTRLPDAPVGSAGLTVTEVVFTADPVTGDIIMISKGNAAHLQLHSLDLKTEKWTHHKDRKPPFKWNKVVMAAGIREHGVLYVLVPKKNKVYLYKHALKSKTPGPQ